MKPTNGLEKGGEHMQAVAFGYRCQVCGRGTVVEKTVPAYHTKIRGYPFVVKGAQIGVCNTCGAEHFAAQETDRWEQMFETEHAKHFLSPEDIQELRKALGLSMEQFASLIGCTRQSLYNWERHDRGKPQSRMADLLMKLVKTSNKKGAVDVIHFLLDEALKLGVRVEPDRSPSEPAWKPVVLRAVQVSRETVSAQLPSLAQMAADTGEGEKQVLLSNAHTGEPVGRLTYDFQHASLELDFGEAPAFEWFHGEVRFADGAVEKTGLVQVKHLRATVLARTPRTEDKVTEVVLFPEKRDASLVGDGG
jgi:putative zinc finger/helix-turn-helix YgiT family protein